MPITIELPHVGESVVEGTIGKWLKQPGDTIRRFEPLVEVVTDKVTMEVPSPVGGSLLKILAQEGETIPMGAPIAEVDSPDTPAPVTTNPVLESVDLGGRSPAATTGFLLHDIAPVGPTGGGMADPAALDADPVAPAEVGDRAGLPADQAGDDQTQAVVSQTIERAPRHSPAVRRLAQERNVDLGRVTGTGMGGRITRDDVLKFTEEVDLNRAPDPAFRPLRSSSDARVRSGPSGPRPCFRSRFRADSRRGARCLDPRAAHDCRGHGAQRLANPPRLEHD